MKWISRQKPVNCPLQLFKAVEFESNSFKSRSNGLTLHNLAHRSTAIVPV